MYGVSWALNKFLPVFASRMPCLFWWMSIPLIHLDRITYLLNLLWKMDKYSTTTDSLNTGSIWHVTTKCSFQFLVQTVQWASTFSIYLISFMKFDLVYYIWFSILYSWNLMQYIIYTYKCLLYNLWMQQIKLFKYSFLNNPLHMIHLINILIWY